VTFGMLLVLTLFMFQKKENWIVFSVVCLRTLKAHQKLKGDLKIFVISGVT
jgi:hypothetical protein